MVIEEFIARRWIVSILFPPHDRIESFQGVTFSQVLMSAVLLIDVDQIDEKSKVMKSVPVPVDLLAGG